MLHINIIMNISFADRKIKSIYLLSREQLRKKAEEDLKENINVIRRNLPAKKDGIAGYLSQTTQEIADQIARNLVDRALELDRKRLVKKIAKLNDEGKDTTITKLPLHFQSQCCQRLCDFWMLQHTGLI